MAPRVETLAKDPPARNLSGADTEPGRELLGKHRFGLIQFETEIGNLQGH